MKFPSISAGNWRSIVPPSSTGCLRYIRADGGQTDVTVAEIYTRGEIPQAEGLANAKAVSALPDCLAALNEVCEGIDRAPFGEPAKPIVNGSALHCAIRAALLKAGFSE